MISRKRKLLELAKALLVIVFLSIGLRFLIPTLTSEEFKKFVENLGAFGPLVIISYTVLSHVFAPLAGTPGILLSAAVFGILETIIYIYLASMISALINFYISRRFGRVWVIKLVGKKAMTEVDSFTQASGTKILIFSRVFGFSLFELISYAAGLTNIDFRKYFIVTLIFTLIPNLFFAFLFENTDFSSTFNLIAWIVTLAVTGLIFSLLVKKFLKKQK